MRKIIIPVCAIVSSTIAPVNTFAFLKSNGIQAGNTNTSVQIKSRSTTSAEDIEQRVKKIIINCLGVEDNEVKLKSKFTDDLGADSLDIVEIVMEIEKEFKIEIPIDEEDSFITVKDAIEYVKGVLNVKK